MEGFSMKYALIENGVIIQIDIDPREGFVEVVSDAVCGQLQSLETGELSNPPKTYSQELAGLNADKKAKEKAFADRISLIHSRNGLAEEPTSTAMRNAILSKIDSDYADSKEALKTKYFGE
jgi:hypothetical protein